MAIRLQVRAVFGGCDKPGNLDWFIDPDAHMILLWSGYWKYMGTGRACPRTSWEFKRYAVLPSYTLSRGLWTVRDGNYPDEPDLGSFRIGHCPSGEDCQCQQGNGGMGQTGDPCIYDCECAYPAVCVHDGFDNPSPYYGECHVTCSTDGDCPSDEHCENFVTGAFDPDDPSRGICVPGRDECMSSQDCPLGYACQPSTNGIRTCVFAVGAQYSGTPCQDDCSCPPGYRCRDVGNGQRQCLIGCFSQADCPGDLCCGDWLAPNLYSGPVCTECMDGTALAPVQ